MCDKTRMAENLIDEYMNLMDKIKKGETLTPEELNAFAQRSILKTVGSMHEMLVGMNNKLARMAENDEESKQDRKAINATLAKHDSRISAVEKQDRFKYITMFTFATVIGVALTIGFVSGTFKVNADVDVAQTVHNARAK